MWSSDAVYDHIVTTKSQTALGILIYDVEDMFVKPGQLGHAWCTEILFSISLCSIVDMWSY